MRIFHKSVKTSEVSLAEKQARKEYRMQVRETAQMILEKFSEGDSASYSHWLQITGCVPEGFVASVQFEDDVNEIIQRRAKKEITVASISSTGIVNLYLH